MQPNQLKRLLLLIMVLLGHSACAPAPPWHIADHLGVRFAVPDSFVVVQFEPLDLGPLSEAQGMQPRPSTAVVLVRSRDLSDRSVTTIPRGEVPAIWVDRVFPGSREVWRQYADTSYTVGDVTVYELPAYPGMFGEAGLFYIASFPTGEWVEIAAHRQEMRSPTQSTGFDAVIAELLPTIELITSPDG